MEVKTAESGPVPKAEADVELLMTNGVNHTVQPDSGDDDSRSSSLSDIEDALENEQLDSISPELRKALVEVDSEAETERIEESPNKIQKQSDIYLSSRPQEKSPSKLIHSTSASDMERDLDGVQIPKAATIELDELPLSNARNIPSSPTSSSEALSPPSDLTGKKRKRAGGGGSNAASETDTEQPLRKRTGSIKSDADGNIIDEDNIDDDIGDFPLRSAGSDDGEPRDGQVQEEDALEQDLDESDHKQVSGKGKKVKKGKRKGKKILESLEETIVTRTHSEAIPEVAIDSPAPTQGEEVDNIEEEEGGVDEGDDAETAARNEEDMAKRMTAMDALAAIEKSFATFRDKIYDDRLANLNEELGQLQAPTSNHPEYLAMLKCIEQRRDDKIRHAKKLFEYQIKALKTKSVAERSQINSQFFQYNRDLRETCMEKVGDEMYRIQRDRWGTEGGTPDYTIKFPTKRSVQITNQTAYNKEVSILSGVAKYVGFPAAPEVEGANQAELDDDFEKMGIAAQTRAPVQPQIQLVRSNFSSSSVIPRASAAEEQFLEQTPWANPQHPIHRQHLNRRISEQARAEEPFATPVAQKRVLDLTAPNGSASTLPEILSNQASSVLNTPADQDPASTQANTSMSLAPTPSHDRTVESTDRMSESRSIPSSPIDQRKAHFSFVQPPTLSAMDTTRASQLSRSSASFGGNAATITHSPVSSRGILFSPPPRPEAMHSTSVTSPDNVSEHRQASPMSAMKTLPGSGLALGTGMTGIASR